VVNPLFFIYGDKMKTKTKIKTKNFSIFLILSLTLLMGTTVQVANAQIPDRYKNYDVYLSISPSHILDNGEVRLLFKQKWSFNRKSGGC
jgi:hypothetical protein